MNVSPKIGADGEFRPHNLLLTSEARSADRRAKCARRVRRRSRRINEAALPVELHQQCKSGQAPNPWRTEGSVSTAVRNTAPSFTQSALLKNEDRGNKKALIGNTNQGFNALEGSNQIEPSSDVYGKANASTLRLSRSYESLGVEAHRGSCAVRYRVQMQKSCDANFS